ncbi:hypothetical protein [Rhodococcus sp. AQ5-07]|uniref:hypothetical protein n=1 Tax=Rhodococcus sp. AQ5-07 TaxID=2054902 RepID=UPI0013B37730|nr:hypothetical protein [Rhodococcus sp. AQ5-07]
MFFRSYQEDSSVFWVGAGNASNLANADVIRPDHGARPDTRVLAAISHDSAPLREHALRAIVR